MTSDKSTKFIVVAKQESVLTSWARDASTFALIVSLIGFGVFVGSTAMQWFGALIAFIAILIKATGISDQNKYDIDGAQAALDKIKAEYGQEND